MDEDKIKEAFSKVKDHISSIEGDISLTKLDLISVKKDTHTITSSLTELIQIFNQYIEQNQQQQLEHTQLLKSIVELTNQQTNRQTQLIEDLKTIFSNQHASNQLQEIFQQLLPKKSLTKNQTQLPTQTTAHEEENPTDRHIFPTHQEKRISQEQIPLDNKPFYSLISSYKEDSTGNRGVPTDKPTNRQTNQHTTQITEKEAKEEKISIQTKLNNLQRASEILASLDSLKKEIRLKFKRLTNQEILIFSTIYQLEEEGNLVDYPLIADTLALSESSVRDYVQKIIAKGIPIEKEKINNKKVLLNISKDLKKIASLDTILQLRDL